MYNKNELVVKTGIEPVSLQAVFYPAELYDCMHRCLGAPWLRLWGNTAPPL